MEGASESTAASVTSAKKTVCVSYSWVATTLPESTALQLAGR